MNEIKAFVGHSFADEDDALVMKFLEHFNQLQSMDIGFSWVNAKKAEAKELAAKVLALIEDKNLFIGICTRRELVIEDEKLESKFMCPGFRCAKESDFIWKASDWIIQEIGLAIGQNMSVILLVEEGLRQPGAFQGNLEFIEFKRSAPTESFSKITDMITALRPKTEKLKQAMATGSTEKEEKEAKKEGDDWLDPKPDWKFDDYESALRYTIAVDKLEDEEKICTAFLISDEGKNEENADKWNAKREFYRIIFGKNGSLEKLKKLANEKPQNSVVQNTFAKAYQHYGEHDKAAEIYLDAANIEVDEKRKFNLLGHGAVAYAKAKNDTKLNQLIKEIKSQSSSIDNGEIALLKVLKEVAKVQENTTTFIAFSERLLDLKPDDDDTRFYLAYSHFEEGHNELSLFHSLKIPILNRSSATWNNLGVDYSELKLNGSAINAYKRAEENGSTLAMSNIANELLNSGFLSESEEYCNKAKQTEDYDKNIDERLFSIKK